jgi:hypothetical protein
MESLSRLEKALYKASEQAFWLRLGSRLQRNCGVEAVFGLQRFALLLTHLHLQSCFLLREPPVQALYAFGAPAQLH